MRRGRQRQTGYVALLTVLVMAVVGLATAVSLLMAGTGSSQTALTEQQSVQARNLAEACAEEAIQTLHDKPAKTVQAQKTIGGGSCEYDVQSTGDKQQTIIATGRVGDSVKRVKLYVTIDASSISVSSWQEIP